MNALVVARYSRKIVTMILPCARTVMSRIATLSGIWTIVIQLTTQRSNTGYDGGERQIFIEE